MRTCAVALCGVFLVSASALAAPILPAQDKPGAVMAYQSLVAADRKATLEAFTGTSLRQAQDFDNLDSCTLRETTEPDATRARLGKTIADCQKELGH